MVLHVLMILSSEFSIVMQVLAIIEYFLRNKGVKGIKVYDVKFNKYDLFLTSDVRKPVYGISGADRFG